MRARIKKGIVLILATLLLCSVTVGFAGCYGLKDYYTEDFNYRKWHDHIEIMSLTDEGKEKEVLVIPRYIGKLPVTAFYRMGGTIWSGNLKKLFVPAMSFAKLNDLEECVNLERVICYRSLKKFSYPSNNEKGSIKAYISSYAYDKDQYGNSNQITDYQHAINTYFANVSYMSNYASDATGYEWIDDYDYGEKITYIPKDPVREGYAFSGWYKEPECINKWDFDVDTLPEEIIVDGVVQYQETKLYAKWES